MVERFQALIGANIREFNRKMKDVDKKVRQTAFETVKPIGANIREFQRKMKKVEKDTKEFKVPAEKSIKADISNFMRKAAEVAVVARTLNREKIIIPIQTKWTNYTKTMGQIATVMRSFEEINQSTMKGLGLFLSPALVPAIASLAGALATIGPMIGTLAGATFALAGAFGAAAAGAFAFGALAVNNLKGVFGASEDLKKLREKLAMADDEEEREKILTEMEKVMGNLNKEEKKALASMEKLSKVWNGISKKLQPEIVSIFTKSLDTLGDVITKLEPTFVGATEAMSNLMDSLRKSLKTDAVVAYFDYLNRTAGPMLELMGKAFGNFGKGIMSMLTAFEPLTNSIANGFLKMSENFAEWAEGLSESKKFQSFMTYVEENMPKLRGIFRDGLAGVTYFFAAFGPLAADVMTELEDMMKRFKEWSKGLGENQSFQSFIDYLRENGPKMIDFIGNLTGFIIELGKGLAPIGSFLLDMVNGFLEWSTALMQNNPWVGKLVGLMISLTGLLMAAIPWIILFSTSLGGPLLNVLKFVGKSLLWVARRAIAGFIAGLIGMTGPIGMVVLAVIALALVIWQNWDKIKETTARVWTIIKGWFDKMKNWLVDIGTKVAVFVLNAVADFLALRRKAEEKFKELLAAGVKAFNDLKNKVKEKIGNAVQEVQDGVAQMPQKIRDKVSEMVSAGADLVGGVISGIKSKIEEGLGVIGGLATSLISRFKRDTETKSPSRAFANVSKWFAPGIVKGIGQTEYKALNAVSKLSRSVVSAFKPDFGFDGGLALTYDTSFGSVDTARMEHAFSGEIQSLELPDNDTYLVVDGRLVGKVVAGHVQEENDKRNSLIKATVRNGREG